MTQAGLPKTKDDSLRAFVAIPLPTQVREEIGRLQSQLRTAGVKARWVKIANCHLTLAFLGEITALQARASAAALHQYLDGQSVFDLCLLGLGVFPGLRRPRVLWCGIGGRTDRLQAVYEGVVRGLSGAQIPMDKKRFQAHITIGRFKNPPPGRLLGDAIGQWGRYKTSFSVDHIVLYRSRLTPEGAIYSALETVILAPAGQVSSNP